MDISFPVRSNTATEAGPPAPSLDAAARVESAGAKSEPHNPDGLPRRKTNTSDSLPPRGTVPMNAVLDAVHGGDLEALRAVYEREAAGRGPVEMWRSTGNNARYDLQHATLVLHEGQGLEQELAQASRIDVREGSEAPNGELHRPLRSGAHASLVDRVKRFPYYSEKPDRLTFENLNGRSLFEDESEPIVCRHLSLAWALQRENAGKNDYTAFRDVDAIQQAVPFDRDSQIECLLQGAADSHIVTSADWGRFATEQLRVLESKGGDAAKRLIVNSEYHSMALELKVKRKPSGVRYVANFYDPEVTVAHKRAASSDRHSFETIRLEDMLDSGFQDYFGRWPVAVVVGMPSGGASAISPLKPGGDAERRLAGSLPALDTPVMHYLMAHGFAGTLRDIQPSFVAQVKDDPALAKRWLIAESKLMSGASGLHQALAKGNAQVTHAVRGLADAISFPVEALDELLTAADDGGTPGFFQAMSDGNAETVHAFVDWVSKSGLPLARKAALLAARDADGEPALVEAMNLDCAEGVRAFVDGIARSGLPASVQMELLDARTSSSDPPALCHAMIENNVASVQAYLDALRLHPTLTARDKVQLVSKGADNDTRLLAYGLRHGGPAAVTALVEGVTRLGLKAADERILLRCSDRTGRPALAEVIRLGKADNVEAFTDAVLASPLSNVDKVEVLRMGRWGARLGSSPTLEAYQEAVRSSALPISAQQLILADVPVAR